MIKQDFNLDWRFARGAVPYTKGDFKKVDLPHDFMIESERTPDGTARRDGAYFSGELGWYEKKFFAEADWDGMDVFVEFEGIYHNAEIKLNGNLIQRQNYGYTTFLVPLSQYLKAGEENTLEVLVDNTAAHNSRWYSGSGIYRYAWLYVVPKLHIEHWGVYATSASISAEAASVQVETTLAGLASGESVTVEHIFTCGEQRVSQSYETSEAVSTVVVSVEKPQLWDVDAPNLYSIETIMHSKRTIVDSAVTSFGIRECTISPTEGLLLNGKSLKMKGGCVHHDNGLLGSASYVRSEERKIELLKQSGYNAVRTAHNPPAPAFLDACDRLGMLVMDEAFDCWREAKTQFDYHLRFDSDWKHDLTNMILRDRNHPSVILWSIGNEIPEQVNRSNAVETCRNLCGLIRSLDNRPVGIGLVPYEEEFDAGVDAVTEGLDFVGMNYMHTRYEAHHKDHPDRIMIGTETVPKEIVDSWGLTEKLPYVIGDFVWTSIDYLGEAGIGRMFHKDERPEYEQHLFDYPWHQAYCGDIDICGFKRPQSYFRDLLWGVDSAPKMFVRRPTKFKWQEEKRMFWGWFDGVAGWDFPGFEKQEVVVDVYTRAKNVTLYCNGCKIGEAEAKDLTATFTLPYEPGEIKAIDSDLSEVVLSTPGAASKVALCADRLELSGAGDLSYVTVTIVDDAGNLVTNDMSEVSFAVSGAGKLLAVGNGNPRSEESYIGVSRAAYDGKLMVVVKSTGVGAITLTAISDGLQSAAVEILSK